MPQAQIDERVERLPLLDKSDIRFSQPQAPEDSALGPIVQDDQGFIWTGSQHGLYRFDGYNFKTFMHDPASPNSLSGSFISSLFKDKTGAMWIGCAQFLDRLDLTTETFTHYPIPFVVHISQDRTGKLWLSTPSGLFSLDPRNGERHRYSHDPEDPLSLETSDVRSTGEDREGRFWVATTNGMDEFNRSTGQVVFHVPLSGPPATSAFFEDRFGVFWVYRNAGVPLSRLDRKSRILTPFDFNRSGQGLHLTGITGMAEDSNGSLWLASIGGGLLRFDREHRRFIRYRNVPLDLDSLPANSVGDLTVDREGIIWVALGGLGLSRFSPNPLPFKRYGHDFGDPISKGDRFVNAIHVDKQGTLWIGTRATLNRIDEKSNRTTYYVIDPKGGSSDVIAIGNDSRGNIWIGTYGHGLFELDRKTRKFTRYRHSPGDPGSLSDDTVTRLLLDHNGNLWACTYDGLDRFDPSTRHFHVYRSDPNEKSLYLELAEDSRGMFWLGTHSLGLQRFDPSNGTFTTFQHDPNLSNSLSDNRVNSILPEAPDAIWIGTQDGLDKFNPETGQFKTYTHRDGLPGTSIGCILEDDRGDLWTSTNNGIAVLDLARQSFRKYSSADGLPGPDLTGWGACSKAPSGKMFFGGFNGATAFVPHEIHETNFSPPVVLTDLRVSGKSISPGKDTLLARSIAYSDSLELKPKERFFSIGFSALSYANPETNRYRYMLTGLDQKWNEVDSAFRTATYTTLAPGTYIFRVQGATSHGPWSEPGKELTITILPSWWQTSEFRIAIALLALMGAIAFYRYRLHQVTSAISARFDERLAERTRLARELHDTFLQTVQGSKMVADDALDPESDEARMRNALEKLSQWLGKAVDEGRAALHALRVSTTEKNHLSEALKKATEDNRLPLSMTVAFSVIGDARDVHPIVRDEVYRIGYEAIRNAAVHSNGTRLDVELRYGNDLSLRIKDNGVGIDPDISDHGKAGHFGLNGMRERASRIRAKLTILSSSSSGTEVAMSVPGDIVYRGTHPTFIENVKTSVKKFLKPWRSDGA